MEGSGRQQLNFDRIHKELAKPNVTLSLLHYEYESECRSNHKIPYSCRSFCVITVNMQTNTKLHYVYGESLERPWKLIEQVRLRLSLIETQEKRKRHIYLWPLYRVAKCRMQKLPCRWISVLGLPPCLSVL